MRLYTTDTSVILEEDAFTLTLAEKPAFPDYTNVTARPQIVYYYKEEETVWERYCLCMQRLGASCPDDSYLGCYALLFRQLYPLLLSSSQPKNAIIYGMPTGCAAALIYQDFMTFLQKDSALTVLGPSPFAFTAAAEGSCHALLYCLDTAPILRAVCDAIEKVRIGGIFLLYTNNDTLPAEIFSLCAQAEKTVFSFCAVYRFSVNDALLSFAGENGTSAFVSSHAQKIFIILDELRKLLQTMVDGATLPADDYTYAAALLQQTEENLLSLYDYLEDDELPILTNRLKEAVMDLAAAAGAPEASGYRKNLTRLSECFLTSLEKEFL